MQIYAELLIKPIQCHIKNANGHFNLESLFARYYIISVNVYWLQPQ